MADLGGIFETGLKWFRRGRFAGERALRGSKRLRIASDSAGSLSEGYAGMEWISDGRGLGQGFTEYGLWRNGVCHSLGQGSCQMGRVSENNAAAGYTVRGL